MWFFGNSKPWAQLSAEEILRHNALNSLWIVGNNSVYDITDVVSTHPGGRNAMLQCGGGRRDCTVDHFFHSSQARSLWNQHKIGEISETEKDKLARRLYDEQHHQEGVSEEGSELENKKDFENSLGSPTLTGDECPLGTTFLNSPDWIVYSSWERNHHQLGSIQGIGS